MAGHHRQHGLAVQPVLPVRWTNCPDNLPQDPRYGLVEEQRRVIARQINPKEYHIANWRVIANVRKIVHRKSTEDGE